MIIFSKRSDIIMQCFTEHTRGNPRLTIHLIFTLKVKLFFNLYGIFIFISTHKEHYYKAFSLIWAKIEIEFNKIVYRQ